MNKAMRNSLIFDQWRHFDDRAGDDRNPGPARAVKISARCADCWGPVRGIKDGEGRRTRIECQLCGGCVDGPEAEREAEIMKREAEDNLPKARVGLGSNYREGARFVLKILPDMDRDTQQVEHRMAVRLAAGRQRGWLSRQEIPPGTAGYLYAQARVFLSGVENLHHEISAIALSDFDFGEPQTFDVEASPADASIRVSAKIPALHRKPSDRELMSRMGTAVVAGMAAAFACEVGMKAILMTRMDEAEKTHDLLKLYKSLPPDSRKRLEADFPEIADVLEYHRHTFGEWRYFEQGAGEDAFGALVNTDRVWGLGKAARMIADECVIAGLTYEVDIDSTFAAAVDRGDKSFSQQVDLTVHGGEAAIPWDEVLDSGRENE